MSQEGRGCTESEHCKLLTGSQARWLDWSWVAAVGCGLHRWGWGAVRGTPEHPQLHPHRVGLEGGLGLGEQLLGEAGLGWEWLLTMLC